MVQIREMLAGRITWEATICQNGAAWKSEDMILRTRNQNSRMKFALKRHTGG